MCVMIGKVRGCEAPMAVTVCTHLYNFKTTCHWDLVIVTYEHFVLFHDIDTLTMSEGAAGQCSQCDEPKSHT